MILRTPHIKKQLVYSQMSLKFELWGGDGKWVLWLLHYFPNSFDWISCIMRRLQQTLLAQTRRIRFGYFDGKFLRFPNFQDLSIVSTHCLMGNLFHNLGHYHFIELTWGMTTLRLNTWLSLTAVLTWHSYWPSSLIITSLILSSCMSNSQQQIQGELEAGRNWLPHKTEVLDESCAGNSFSTN